MNPLQHSQRPLHLDSSFASGADDEVHLCRASSSDVVWQCLIAVDLPDTAHHEPCADPVFVRDVRLPSGNARDAPRKDAQTGHADCSRHENAAE